MRILITGVYGFVGSNLVKALKKENEIYGLDIVSPEKEGVVKTFSWDDLEKDGLRVQEINGSSEGIPDVDVIIHLAGIAHETKEKSKAEKYFKVNTDLTKKVYDYFLASKAKKFIFFSSIKAAADRV